MGRARIRRQRCRVKPETGDSKRLFRANPGFSLYGARFLMRQKPPVDRQRPPVIVLLRIPQQKRAGFERIPLKSCTFQVSVQRLFLTLSLLTRRADAFKDQSVPRDPIPGFRRKRFVQRWVV